MYRLGVGGGRGRGNARFSANQSICTISIEIAQAAITSISARENSGVASGTWGFDVAFCPARQGAVYAVLTEVKNSAA